MRKIIAFMISVFLIGPALSQGLHVSGNKILNNQNNVVHLRGVNKAGTEYMCLSGNVFDGPTDQTSINAMLAWAINIVRLPMNEQCWLGINGLPSGLSGAIYQSTIVDYVDLLATNDVASIIDLQWAAPGTTQSTGTHRDAECRPFIVILDERRRCFQDQMPWSSLIFSMNRSRTAMRTHRRVDLSY